MEEETFEKRENQTMEEEKIAQVGSFCWNETCTDYGQVGKGNVIKNGKTEKGVQRYRCQTCKQTFTQTKGTLFYRCRHSKEEIVECLAMVGDRNSLAAIHRILVPSRHYVLNWKSPQNVRVGNNERLLWLLNSQIIFGL